jgi:hypothetical protein
VKIGCSECSSVSDRQIQRGRRWRLRCGARPAPPGRRPSMAMLREVEEMAERVRRDGFCLLKGVIPPEAVVS